MSRNLRRSWLPCGAVFLAFTISFQCAAATWHVDRSAPPNGDGASWPTAFQYLQDALHASLQDGDLIKIADGTYHPDENSAFPNGGDPSGTSFLIEGKRLLILGSFAGFGAPIPDEQDIDLHPTILSGDLLDNDNPNDVNTLLDNAGLFP